MSALHLVPALPQAERTAAGGTVQATENRRVLQLVDENREICAIARGTVQAAIEVLAGTRPIQQLSRRLDLRCLASCAVVVGYRE